MKTTPKHKVPVVYVLQLEGDIECTAGITIAEIGGTSLDRSKLETLREKKERELDEYFDGRQAPCDCDDEECEEDHDSDGDVWCYLNTDYSTRPTWVIASYPLL